MYAEAHAVWTDHKFRDNYSLWAIETFIFCELFRWMLSSYSAIIRLIIQGMFASEYVLALSRSEDRFGRIYSWMKSWMAVTMGNWKSAGTSFWALYGKRRIGVWPAELSYMTTCCHYRLWRPFSASRKPSHFSASFLTARQQQKITTDGNRSAPWLSSLEAL